MDPDLTLIEALKRGDDSALTTLMDRHREALFYFAFRYARNEAIARDVVQETFVRAYFNAAKFKTAATVKTWLYSIALNLCRDHIRKLGTRREAYSLDAPPLEGTGTNTALHDSAGAPDQTAEKQDRYRLLQRAIDQLPPRLREALILFSIEGKSQKESAAILGTNPKTVELRVYRAKQKLRDLLENVFDSARGR